MKNRYRVSGRDMDGIVGYFVVDTHHPLYKLYGENDMGPQTQGLSMHKQEMIDLANKLNEEAAE
jgi:hypothetical protein